MLLGKQATARVRARRAVVRPAVAACAQSVEHRATTPAARAPDPGRRSRRGWRAVRARHRYRRLGAHAGVDVRRRRIQADVRRRGPRRRDPVLVELRSRGTVDAHGGGCGARAAGDRRPRRADPGSARRPVPDFARGLARGIRGMRFGVLRHHFEEDTPSQRRTGPGDWRPRSAYCATSGRRSRTFACARCTSITACA